MNTQFRRMEQLCALGMLLLFGYMAHAQDSGEGNNNATDNSNQDSTVRTVQTSNVVVSASRWEERASVVSREIASVLPMDIQRYNSPTTADVLFNTGTVMVQKSQLGGGSPMLRGYAANAVLLVVDGVRVNNAIFRSGNLQNVILIDANALDGAEVLFGPGSVQYGSDALGGAMVFRTRQARFSHEGLAFGGSGLLRYGSASNEVTGSAALDISSKHVASSTVITVSRFGDLRGGGTFNTDFPEFGKRPWYVDRLGDKDTVISNADPLVQTPTGYTQLNVTENLSWKISDPITLSYGGTLTTSTDVPRYDRLVESRNNQPRFAEWYYGPQTWTMHNITLRTNDAGPLGTQATVTAGFQYYEESRHDRNLNSNSRRSLVEQVLVGSINADVRVALDANQGMERDLYYGIEAYTNSVESKGMRRNIVTGEETATVPRYPDGGAVITSGAAYVQTRWGFSEALTASAGLRFTYYDMQATVRDTALFNTPFTSIGLNTSALTGSVGVVWQALQHMAFHVNVANGFRAPNLDDAAKVFENAPGIIVVPSPDLKPEYANTLEGGVVLGTDDIVSIRLDAYHTWATDAIELRPATWNGQDSIFFNGETRRVYANTNIGTAVVYGGNLRLRSRPIRNMLLTATVSLNEGRDTKNNIPLRHTAPLFGTISATWQGLSWFATLQHWWSAEKAFADLPPEEQAKVGINYTTSGALPWMRFDLLAGWNVHRDVEVQVRLENLLDLQYRTYASAISAPGRNLVGAIRYTW